MQNSYFISKPIRDHLLTSSARQTPTLTLTPLVILKTSATFWAIKRSKQAKIRKVIKLERSPRKPVEHICASSGYPVKALFNVVMLSLVIGQALIMILPFPKSVAKSAKQLQICSRKLWQHQWSNSIEPTLSDHRTQSGLLTTTRKLRRIQRRMGWDPLLEQMAVMIVSMLMQRQEKSTMDCIVPMWVIAVFPLVLWESAKIHDVLRGSFYLAWKLSFDKNLIPLQEESRRFHWIGFEFETRNLLGCKIPLKHMGCKDLWHGLNQNLRQSNTSEVLMLGQL